MLKEENKKRLKKIIYNNISINFSDEISPDDIVSDMSLIDDLSFESVEIMDLLIKIQEEFTKVLEIEYNPPFISPQEITDIINNTGDLKVKSLERLIEKKLETKRRKK
jgi:acyl carrier protein